jgi:release factor glutamine methyltransferase
MISKGEKAAAAMNVREAVAAATATLMAASDTPRLDAELLMAHALRLPREDLLLHALDREPPAAFDALVARRLAHEPVAYITGRRAFWTIEVEVGPGVLIPRPDSETLIEAALAIFGRAGPVSILDLGTGPGSLLLAALDQWPGATGLGVDRSERALGFAQRNAERLGLADRARFQRGDWGEGIDARFDLVLCNPPYVDTGTSLPPEVALWEPAEALLAGPEGLDLYRRLAPQIGRLIAPGGAACVEIGAGQEKAAGTLFAEQGFTISSRPDLNRVPRCLILRVEAAEAA